MDTKLIGGLLVAVVVLGGGYYFYSGSGSMSATDQAAAVAQSQRSTFEGSLMDLAARGGDWECTVDASTDQAISNGTVHVSGSKVRGDFTSIVSGAGNVESHMIADGTDMYAWTSMLPQGFKVSLSAADETGGAISDKGFDAHQAYSYSCAPATVDQSLFALPSDVEFTTI